MRTYQCALPKASEVNALTFRLFMPWRDNRPMAVRCRHADCKVLVSKDQKEWTEVASMKGVAPAWTANTFSHGRDNLWPVSGLSSIARLIPTKTTPTSAYKPAIYTQNDGQTLC